MSTAPPVTMADPSERFRSTLAGMLYFNSGSGETGGTAASTAEKGAAAGGSGGASAAAAVAAAGAEPARRECRPGDRRDFLRRLATFKASKWFAKPPVVRPARYALVRLSSTDGRSGLPTTLNEGQADVARHVTQRLLNRRVLS